MTDTGRVPHVLISGASIAGPTVAYWLHRYGWRTTVVERADGLREEGQNIDVRGAGREVARRMGIEDAIRAAGTGERGLQFVDDSGRVIADFPQGHTDSGGPTAELEILRGELSRIVYERTRDDTEYLFGDQITGIDDGDDGVAVTFQNAPPQTFDLVVLAEGLRSRTRATVFPDPRPVRELDLYSAYLTIPRTGSDNDRWRWLHAGRARSVMLRPDNLGTTRAMLAFISDVRGLEDLDRAEQVMVLRRTFADVGWETSRILAALDDAPMYFEAVGQARLGSWSHGRVVLVGDAAYCSSPISGMSTSLALTGAYVLAGELAARSDADPRTALARYEQIMRPYVDGAQKLRGGAPRTGNPRTPLQRTALNTVLRVAASAPARRVGGLAEKLFAPPADWADLPSYDRPAVGVAGA